MEENFVAIRRVAADAIEAVNMLQEIVLHNPGSVTDLKSAVGVISRFPKDMEQYDRAMLFLETFAKYAHLDE